jgi:hypothetical protein
MEVLLADRFLSQLPIPFVDALGTTNVPVHMFVPPGMEAVDARPGATGPTHLPDSFAGQQASSAELSAVFERVLDQIEARGAGVDAVGPPQEVFVVCSAAGEAFRAVNHRTKRARAGLSNRGIRRINVNIATRTPLELARARALPRIARANSDSDPLTWGTVDDRVTVCLCRTCRCGAGARHDRHDESDSSGTHWVALDSRHRHRRSDYRCIKVGDSIWFAERRFEGASGSFCGEFDWERGANGIIVRPRASCAGAQEYRRACDSIDATFPVFPSDDELPFWAFPWRRELFGDLDIVECTVFADRPEMAEEFVPAFVAAVPVAPATPAVPVERRPTVGDRLRGIYRGLVDFRSQRAAVVENPEWMTALRVDAASRVHNILPDAPDQARSLNIVIQTLSSHVRQDTALAAPIIREAFESRLPIMRDTQDAVDRSSRRWERYQLWRKFWQAFSLGNFVLALGLMAPVTSLMAARRGVKAIPLLRLTLAACALAAKLRWRRALAIASSTLSPIVDT